MTKLQLNKNGKMGIQGTTNLTHVLLLPGSRIVIKKVREGTALNFSGLRDRQRGQDKHLKT